MNTKKILKWLGIILAALGITLLFSPLKNFTLGALGIGLILFAVSELVGSENSPETSGP